MSRKSRFLFLISGNIVLLDQITKVWVQKRFQLHESLVLIEGYLSLTYVLNPGAAFGFFADQGATFRMVFFLSVSVIALLLLGAFFRDTPSEDSVGLMALSLLFGGAVGNLIDRIRQGEVIDFIDFYIGRSHWPAFNVADSAITIGISLLMVHLYLQKKETDSHA